MRQADLRPAGEKGANGLMVSELIFVYNADAGVFNAMADLARKIFSPSTYPCRLCALTYTPVGMKRRWRRFLKRLPVETRFLHRDEWQTQYPERREPLPAVWLRSEQGMEPLLDAAALAELVSLDALQDRLTEALARRGITGNAD